VVSQKLRIRPSQLCGIHDDLEAWAFDRAAWFLAAEIEHDLEQIKGKNEKAVAQRREQRLHKWLGGADDTPKGRFREPIPGKVRRA
jgi:hypothetical protein